MPKRLLLAITLAATSAAAQQLTATDRARAAAAVWAGAKYNYAWWDHVRADWDSALGATLRAANEPQSDVRFYRRLRRVVALLNAGEAPGTPPPPLRGPPPPPPHAPTPPQMHPATL